MKVQITDVGEREGRVRVAFTCESGTGEAYWVGPAPSRGDTRFVELELRCVSSVGRELIETEEPIGLRVEDGLTFVVGEVDSFDRSGVAWFSVGSHRLGVEVSGQPPQIGRRYRIVASDLEAFDCQL